MGANCRPAQALWSDACRNVRVHPLPAREPQQKSYSVRRQLMNLTLLCMCSCLDDKGMDEAVKDIAENKVASGYEGVPSSQNEEDD